MIPLCIRFFFRDKKVSLVYYLVPSCPQRIERIKFYDSVFDMSAESVDEVNSNPFLNQLDLRKSSFYSDFEIINHIVFYLFPFTYIEKNNLSKDIVYQLISMVTLRPWQGQKASLYKDSVYGLCVVRCHN